MPSVERLIRHEDLHKFCVDLLEAAGLPAAQSAFAVETLVAANLRGVDSHGVQLLVYYLEQLQRGDVDPRTDGRVISESGACLLYDGQNGMGQTISAICCDHAVRLARGSGLGLVLARDSSHFGAAAYWAQRIAASGMVGIVMCNASPIVPPWQGKQGRLGTNPICMCVPGGEEPAWLLDMATTTVAAGKILKASLSGEPTIPAGWAMDVDGVPTTDTGIALEHLLLSPLGGYKGSGLAMMVEILCGVLGGGALAMEIGTLRTAGPMRPTQTFLAIDIQRFIPLADFRARMDRLIRDVKSAAPAEGYSEVLVAGEPEERMERERRCTGIPLAKGTWDKLAEAAGKLGVTVPE
jgi:LDH2 family malate/lactate/ureidoglycolate dehydrogenase